MNVEEQIKNYITSQPEPKRSDMRELHRLTLQVSPECKLWFSDGKDSKNHTVSNPTIGYGLHTIKYANGQSPGCDESSFSPGSQHRTRTPRASMADCAMNA